MTRFANTVAMICLLSTAPTTNAQDAHRMPRIAHEHGRYALIVDGAPFLMLGAQSHNSSNWPSTLPKIWEAIEYLHANTLEVPIYWEQFEPQQGQFDYSEVDLLLTQAREHHVRLVLLWFGTWKNGSQHYMPEWMKLQPDKYRHDMAKTGELMDSPSPFAEASQAADIRAFSAFMSHLKAADPERTVIMVQVENETGSYGTLRDYAPDANQLFASAVPPEVIKAMGRSAPSGASWEAVFGPGEADVCFNAWAIAKYVGSVAAAGKAIYPLPLYVNVALRDPLKPGTPGTYESGGPTDNVIPIWKLEAPAIDVIGPDIYLGNTASYLKVLELYDRPDNALFVPETASTQQLARFFFSVLGHHGIGYSPFGLDLTRNFLDSGDFAAGESKPGVDPKYAFLEPTAENYRLIAPMMADVARLSYEGKLEATAEVDGQGVQVLHFKGWDAVVSYGGGRGRPAKGNPEPVGRALIAQLRENQFLVTGYHSHVDFRPAPTAAQKKSAQVVIPEGQTPSIQVDGKWMHRQFLRVEEGRYETGSFLLQRVLNGDETDWGLVLGSEPTVIRAVLSTY